uniref:Uncharacterized protein n=1 Tax=Lygus hesperus TaxID=30085 RepID=A0A146LU45_LYGHE
MSWSSASSQQKKRKKTTGGSSGSESPSPEKKKASTEIRMFPPGTAVTSYDQLYEQLMVGFRGLMNEQTTSFKESLQRVENAVTSLSADNGLIKARCDQLDKENTQLREYVEQLDLRLRRNNLVLNGFAVDPSKNLKSELVQLLRDVMKVENVNFSTLTVNTLGGRDSPPILLEFGSSYDAQSVLKKTGNLKGTSFYISRDMPATQRVNRNKFLKLRYEIKKVCPNKYPKIVMDKMILEEKAFKWTGGGLMSDNGEGLTVLREITGKDFSEIVKKIQEFKPTQRNMPR